MPIIRTSDCVPLPVVVCPVEAVVMLESWVARCVHWTTATTGQTTTGSGMQSDFLMMGIKMHETC